MNELIQIGSISPLRQRLIDDMAMHRFSKETQRKDHLERARRLLDVAPAPPDDPPDEPEVRPTCPCCGGHMIIIEIFERRYQPRAPPPPSLTPRIPAP